MSAFVLALLASVLISLISLSGGSLLIWGKLFAGGLSSYLVSFAAGVMLTVAFFDLFPEAQAQTQDGNIFIAAFLGMVTFFFLERFLLWFHHHDLPAGKASELHGTKPAAVLIIVGDGVHNLLDGVVIATAFIANPAVGLLATVAVAAHEIPQEIADFSALVGLGMKRGKALFFNFLSATVAILGTFLTFVFFDIVKTNLSPLLAFTAGMFIYIAASDLIPELHSDATKGRNWILVLPFLVGILIIAAMTTYVE